MKWKRNENVVQMHKHNDIGKNDVYKWQMLFYFYSMIPFWCMLFANGNMLIDNNVIRLNLKIY